MIPVAAIYRNVQATAARMSPEELAQTFARAKAIYKTLPPGLQAQARKIQRDLAQADPREPAGMAGFGAVFSNIVSGMTAIAGVYLSYEQMQEQKKTQRAAQSAAEQEAAFRRAMEQEQMKAAAAQPAASGANAEWFKNPMVLAGGAAAAALLLVVAMK
jgi:hypothetical protein